MVKIAFLFYFLGQILFLVNIQFPTKPNFDEFHYIPSAKQFLELKKNQNQEHPPLGKILIAASIGTFGDRPIGWRFASTVFGALTLAGMYVLGWVLFRDPRMALWSALLTLTNQLLYVQSRIAMLDTFMFAFLVWALVGFCSLWDPTFLPRQQKKALLFAGVCFGLATACKWFAMIPWIACWGVVAVIWTFQNWKVTFHNSGNPKNPSKETTDLWYRPELWLNLSPADWFLYLGLVPIGAYLSTFIPYFFIPDEHFTFADFFTRQIEMWEQQLRVVNSHPYMSDWKGWPIMARPICYAFDREGLQNEWVRDVVLLGNPLVMWGGLAAIAICAWDWIRTGNRSAFLITFFYSVFYFSWALIPRKISFYYYYYPAGMMLSFALAYVFYLWKDGGLYKIPVIRPIFLGAALGLFLYFFPILAGLRIPTESFRQWMWFRSWI